MPAPPRRWPTRWTMNGRSAHRFRWTTRTFSWNRELEFREATCVSQGMTSGFPERWVCAGNRASSMLSVWFMRRNRRSTWTGKPSRATCRTIRRPNWNSWPPPALPADIPIVRHPVGTLRRMWSGWTGMRSTVWRCALAVSVAPRRFRSNGNPHSSTNSVFPTRRPMVISSRQVTILIWTRSRMRISRQECRMRTDIGSTWDLAGNASLLRGCWLIRWATRTAR